MRGKPSKADLEVLREYNVLEQYLAANHDGKSAEFDSPLYHNEAIPVPLSVQAAIKPIIEMLAIVQARLRTIEKAQLKMLEQKAEIRDALWALKIRQNQQD